MNRAYFLSFPLMGLGDITHNTYYVKRRIRPSDLRLAISASCLRLTSRVRCHTIGCGHPANVSIAQLLQTTTEV